jgi:hypothetical protein
MAIFYPQLDKNVNGRVPLYIKVVPRGDLADKGSEISSLELLTVSYQKKKKLIFQL